MVVSVVLLVEAGQLADVGTCLVRYESSLMIAGHCGDVVVKGQECAVIWVI